MQGLPFRPHHPTWLPAVLAGPLLQGYIYCYKPICQYDYTCTGSVCIVRTPYLYFSIQTSFSTQRWNKSHGGPCEVVSWNAQALLDAPGRVMNALVPHSRHWHRQWHSDGSLFVLHTSFPFCPLPALHLTCPSHLFHMSSSVFASHMQAITRPGPMARLLSF